jgi:pyridoxine kinase
MRVAGTGDTFTALFTGHYVRDRDAAGALRFAMQAMDVICAATEKSDADELLIVQTQDRWAK